MTVARIISLMDAPPKYPGEKVISVVCPYCGEVHKHRGEQQSKRVARCDPTKEYEVRKW